VRTLILGLALVGWSACGDNAAKVEPDAAIAVDAPIDVSVAPLGDILDELRAIPGLEVEEGTTMAEGYRFFLMEYDQPVDHHNPAGPHFKQRMTLMHRDYTAPVVGYNSGYFVSTRSSRSQLTFLLEGNQLSMEHRYFAPSRPNPADWTKLTIEQAANDQHRITQALKARIYHDNKWLTTGASKGGMTSLFHRRFFPADVDATVALVAPFDYPADAVASPTNRYFVFLENVGTDPACRQKLKDFQNVVLARRAAMKTRMTADDTFSEILGEDRALEFAVEELPFIFWQYGSQSDCASIPAAAASDDDVYEFLDETVGMAAYGDVDVLDFLPYYHQSATQLGYPAADESYLVGLIYPGQDTAAAYVPAGIPTPAYDNGAAMQDVQSWIATSGERIMLIYGQNDPWTAGAVSLGDATDSFKFISPNGNHGSSIGTLAQADQSTAVAAVLRWAGVPTVNARRRLQTTERTTEALELERRHRR
jgi:hypothetical protein